MKIEDLLDKMSKSYLDRIVKSYTNPIYSKDEEGYRKQIKSNIDFLSDSDKIKERMDGYLETHQNAYHEKLLINFVLQTLLKSNQYSASQVEILTNIENSEKEIISNSKKDEHLSHIEEGALEVFKTILEAALEDDVITKDEQHLINKIRKKLSIQEKDQYLVQARLNHFPRKNNTLHSPKEINKALNDVQKAGIVFYCNRANEPFFVIPEEFLEGVKSYLGVELIDDKFKDVLNVFRTNELREILAHLNIKQSGKKEDVINRIIISGAKPSEVLDIFSNSRLTDVCRELPDLKSSGKKDEKIHRLIRYFDGLLNIEIDRTGDERDVYYDFFEQLAKKDMANLIGKNIVKHETDAELAFEKATSYLFEKKFNHKVIKQEGTEHSDGCIYFGNNGELFMWDNKTKMIDKYNFPNNHLKQFKRYIRDAYNNGYRVKCFLVIVPEFDESASDNAERLKIQSGVDTDVAVISAKDLKWVADEWARNNSDKQFNLHIFNKTGILTKDDLKSRIKLFG